jgi:hypothetical protein
MSKVPPCRVARSRMLARPLRADSSLTPTPLSVTVSVSLPACETRLTYASEGSACRMTLDSASRRTARMSSLTSARGAVDGSGQTPVRGESPAVGLLRPRARAPPCALGNSSARAAPTSWRNLVITPLRRVFPMWVPSRTSRSPTCAIIAVPILLWHIRHVLRSGARVAGARVMHPTAAGPPGPPEPSPPVGRGRPNGWVVCETGRRTDTTALAAARVFILFAPTEQRSVQGIEASKVLCGPAQGPCRKPWAPVNTGFEG